MSNLYKLITTTFLFQDEHFTFQPQTPEQSNQQTTNKPPMSLHGDCVPSSNYDNDKRRRSSNVSPGSGGSYVCNICQKGFSSDGNRKRHEKLHSRVRYECPVCSRTFISENDMDVHLTADHGKERFRCDRCPKRFGTKCGLHRHHRLYHGTGRIKCNQCDRQFADKTCLETHINMHAGVKPYTCKDCSKSFAGLSYLRRHQQYYCKKPVPSGSRIPCHPVVISEPSETTSKRDVVAMKRPTTSTCGTNSPISTDSTHSTNTNSSSSTKNNVKCDAVGNTKKNPLQNTTNKPFQCDTCSSSFHNLWGLTRHQKIHTGEGLLECIMCQMKFRCRSSLDGHLNKHAGIKPYQCERCHKKFSYIVTLGKHNRYSCPLRDNKKCMKDDN